MKKLSSAHPDYIANEEHKHLISENTFCEKCGLIKKHNCFTLFRTGFSCECKEEDKILDEGLRIG